MPKQKSINVDNVNISLIVKNIRLSFNMLSIESYKAFYYSIINDYIALSQMYGTASGIDELHSFAFFNVISNLKAVINEYNNLGSRKQIINLPVNQPMIFYNVRPYILLYIEACDSFYRCKIDGYE